MAAPPRSGTSHNNHPPISLKLLPLTSPFSPIAPNLPHSNSLGNNDMGPAGAASIGDALKVNKTVTRI